MMHTSSRRVCLSVVLTDWLVQDKQSPAVSEGLCFVQQVGIHLYTLLYACEGPLSSLHHLTSTIKLGFEVYKQTHTLQAWSTGATNCSVQSLRA